MKSIWNMSVPEILSQHNTLDSDLSCDIAIIGGGLTGISCAYYLAKQGLKVIILEKNHLMSKTSGNTTAKITAQHDLFYKYLIDTFGTDTAKKYLDCNLEALKNIKTIIDDEHIDCDFEYQNSYVFTQSKTFVHDIENEVKSLHSIGYHAKLLNNIPLPIDGVLSAIAFPDQAQFNPRKYAQGLCRSIINNKGLIFENSKVTNIQKTHDYYSIKANNFTIKCKYTILACRYPFINIPGFYFLKMYQTLSYCAAYNFDGNAFLGMYINAENPTLSARIAQYDGKDVLVLSGCSHKTGKDSGVSNPYDTLSSFAHSIYPNAKIITTWSTEDSVSLDKLPYIGQFSTFMPNAYVATGFKKWGMAFSNAAANMITDEILGKKNKFADIFNATRVHPIENKEEMGNMLKESTSSILLKKFSLPNDTILSLANDEGKIVEYEGNKVGVYKDSQGKIYKVKPICTHLGCEVSWNQADRTWDCPCHGSRFNYDGKLLYGPALKNLDTFNDDELV